MQNKVIRLTESELKKLIQKVIEEQTMGQSFQQGMQSTQGSGKAAQQAVVQAGQQVMKGAKQVVVKIGNVAFTIVTYGAAVVWLIGKGIYRIGAATSNALLKLLSATGKLVVGAATAVGDAAVSAFKAAGVAIEKGADWVMKQLTSLKDSTVAVGQWIIQQAKQFGSKIYGAILAGANKIGELGSKLGNWLGSQWSTIQNQVGMAWDQAKNAASNAWQSAKSGIQNAANAVSNKASQVGSAISSGVKSAANTVSNYAGKAAGWLKGFLSEMFSRYLSFSGNNTNVILSEARQFNSKSIIL